MIDVTYIFSVNYSGSHLLAHLLGAHAKCASIGELRNFHKFTSPGKDRSTASDFSRNPIFQGLGDVPQSEWYELIYPRVIAEYPEVTMLIDNSKKVEWARRFAADPRIRSHYVHLIRDPRALLRRWLNDYDTPHKRRRQRRTLVLRAPSNLGVALLGRDHDVLLHKWLLANRRITRFMEAAGQPSRVLTYHDLVTNTADELRVLTQGLGLEFESGQLNFGAGKSFGTRKVDYVAMSERSEIRLDLRWKEDLEPEIHEIVTANKRVLRYLQQIGLTFCSDGLTRVTA